MITEEKRIEKTCSFYASDYHLEMIMVPYINKKMDEQAQIEIITEKSLEKTVKIVIKNVNLSKERKQKLLNLNWANNCTNNLKESSQKGNNSNNEQIIFVVGSMNYIDHINQEIEKIASFSKTKIINCYSIEDMQKNATEIATKHTKILNTKTEKELGKNYC